MFLTWHLCRVWPESTVNAAVDGIAPQQAEDDGAGEEEVKQGDFNLSNPERKAKAKWSTISKNIDYINEEDKFCPSTII